jgi:hypothetical protein
MPAAPDDVNAIVPGGGAVLDAMAAQGFEGLELGFGSFPIVSLDQGTFKLSDGGTLGEEFYCQMKSVRPKWLIKTALAQNDQRHALLYSYDGQTDMKGEPVAKTIAAWAAQGIAMERKKYLEIFAILADGNNVLLSVPPTSVGRCSAELVKIYTKGYAIGDVWIKCSKGPKVTQVAVPFIPWAFQANL